MHPLSDDLKNSATPEVFSDIDIRKSVMLAERIFSRYFSNGEKMRDFWLFNPENVLFKKSGLWAELINFYHVPYSPTENLFSLNAKIRSRDPRVKTVYNLREEITIQKDNLSFYINLLEASEIGSGLNVGGQLLNLNQLLILSSGKSGRIDMHPISNCADIGGIYWAPRFVSFKNQAELNSVLSKFFAFLDKKNILLTDELLEEISNLTYPCDFYTLQSKKTFKNGLSLGQAFLNSVSYDAKWLPEYANFTHPIHQKCQRILAAKDESNKNKPSSVKKSFYYPKALIPEMLVASAQER